MIKKAKISQNRPDYAETQKLLPAAFVRSTHLRERERERERETERDRERQRETETETETDRQTDRQRQRQRDRDRETDIEIETETNRDRDREVISPQCPLLGHYIAGSSHTRYVGCLHNESVAR